MNITLLSLYLLVFPIIINIQKILINIIGIIPLITLDLDTK